jgi:K+-transporting ATPase ATPase C chain
MTTTDTVTPGPLQPASTARPSASALVSIAGRQALVALRFLLAMTVIVGIAYPLLILGIGQLATKGAVNGSLVTDNTGTVVGSKLIGQRFDGPQRRAQIAADDGVDPADVPPDAVTASGSGLDPDISPAYAEIQVNRVAAARGLSAEQVRDLVQAHTQGRALGFIGEERVNVLELNLALQQLAPTTGG